MLEPTVCATCKLESSMTETQSHSIYAIVLMVGRSVDKEFVIFRAAALSLLDNALALGNSTSPGSQAWIEGPR